MLKPIFINVCISLFVSSIIFLISLMLINNEYNLLKFNKIHNGQNLFYFLWINPLCILNNEVV